jgi:hypothetical protein
MLPPSWPRCRELIPWRAAVPSRFGDTFGIVWRQRTDALQVRPGNAGGLGKQMRFKTGHFETFPDIARSRCASFIFTCKRAPSTLTGRAARFCKKRAARTKLFGGFRGHAFALGGRHSVAASATPPLPRGGRDCRPPKVLRLLLFIAGCTCPAFRTSVRRGAEVVAASWAKTRSDDAISPTQSNDGDRLRDQQDCDRESMRKRE